jgi:putative isomerase
VIAAIRKSALVTALVGAIASGFACGAMSQTTVQPYVYKGNLRMDLSKVPFSRAGSYISFSELSRFPRSLRREGVFLRDLHQGGEQSFRLELIEDGKSVPFTIIGQPTLLTVTSDKGTVQICFQGTDRLRIRGSGVTLRLTAEDGAWSVRQAPSRWEVNTSATKYMLWPVAGKLEMDAPWTGTGSEHVVATFAPQHRSDDYEGEIDAYTSVWEPHEKQGTFDEVRAKEARVYSDWLNTMPSVEARYGPGAELAAYVNWESMVDPEGNLKRRAMLMSKNWMNAVWSWDQCFNAMALSLSNLQLAWDQFMLPIDVQGKSGVFPDKWDGDNIVWEYSKPPVHGWVLAWMMNHSSQFGDKDHARQVYDPLVKWTEWYFKYRDIDHNGFPEYRHGDESGWDNSTVMLSGSPVESPDLDAYLIVQMDTLAKLASVLGREKESEDWHLRSARLLNATIHHFWDGNKFVAYHVGDHTPIESDSLQLFMPLILGSRLPKEIQTRMVEQLKDPARFLTQHGLATESLKSKSYTPDGYWRGPIWAPTTMILSQSLEEIGQREFANKLREQFCLMAQDQGMSENYDAVTGNGLRDPAYTWTSSVYLILAHELLLQARH